MIKEIPQNKHLHNLAFRITPLPYLFRTLFFFIISFKKHYNVFITKRCIYTLNDFRIKRLHFTNQKKERKKKKIMECLQVRKKEIYYGRG